LFDILNKIKERKNPTLNDANEKYYFLFIFGIILSLNFLFLVILTITSMVLGVKNADTKNGASKWKCFLSYLYFGNVYIDHRKN